MAETVRSLQVTVTLRGTVVGDDGALLPVDETYTQTFTDGTASGNVGNVWQDKDRSLDTTSEDLDLGAGGLTDFQGADLVLNNAKLVYLRNLTATTGDNLRLKEGSVNPVTSILNGTGPEVEIGPSGILLLVNPVDGYTVTNGSADTIGIEAVDTQTYRAIIAGDNA